MKLLDVVVLVLILKTLTSFRHTKLTIAALRQ